MNNIHKLIASGFYSGYAKKAPGTIGTIFFVVLWILLFSLLSYSKTQNLPLYNFYILIFISFIGTISCKKVLVNSNDKDPKWVVIDEWLGMSIALQTQFIFSQNIDFLNLVIAFLIFRLFDIVKPFPINKLEELPDASGVMADDAGCGVIALSVLILFNYLNFI